MGNKESVLQQTSSDGPKIHLKLGVNQSDTQRAARLLQVEAMKTRESARKMVEYMRQVNPALAKALTDDRDEVWHLFSYTIIMSNALFSMSVRRWCCQATAR